MTTSAVFLERLWAVLYGHVRGPREIPIITSLLYFSLTLTLARLFRAVANQTPSCLRPYLLSSIAAWMACACSLENGQIRAHYGDLAYSLDLLLLAFWTTHLEQGAHSNICSQVLDTLNGKISRKKAVCLATSQTVGGLLSYQYARLFWSLRLTRGHAARLLPLPACETALMVPAPIGFCVELFGTTVDAFLTMTTFTPFYVYEMGSKAIFNVLMTLWGLNITGMYLNPVNASNQTFGCYGTTIPIHIIVYWVAPMLGVTLAMFLYTNIQSFRKRYAICFHCRSGMFKLFKIHYNSDNKTKAWDFEKESDKKTL